MPTNRALGGKLGLTLLLSTVQPYTHHVPVSFATDGSAPLGTETPIGAHDTRGTGQSACWARKDWCLLL